MDRLRLFQWVLSLTCFLLYTKESSLTRKFSLPLFRLGIFCAFQHLLGMKTFSISNPADVASVEVSVESLRVSSNLMSFHGAFEVQIVVRVNCRRASSPIRETTQCCNVTTPLAVKSQTIFRCTVLLANNTKRAELVFVFSVIPTLQQNNALKSNPTGLKALWGTVILGLCKSLDNVFSCRTELATSDTLSDNFQNLIGTLSRVWYDFQEESEKLHQARF